MAWVCKSIKTCDVNLNTSLKHKNVSGLCNGIFYEFFLLLCLSSCWFSFHVCCSLWSSKERQNKLNEREDYTCGQWKVVSHLFLLFGFILIFWMQWEYLVLIWYIDALPSSLIDSKMSLKWKQRKCKESKHIPWLVALWG